MRGAPTIQSLLAEDEVIVHQERAPRGLALLRTVLGIMQAVAFLVTLDVLLGAVAADLAGGVNSWLARHAWWQDLINNPVDDPHVVTAAQTLDHFGPVVFVLRLALGLAIIASPFIVFAFFYWQVEGGLTEYALTTKHVYVRKLGPFGTLHIVPLSQVTGVHVATGPILRRFRRTTVELETRGPHVHIRATTRPDLFVNAARLASQHNRPIIIPTATNEPARAAPAGDDVVLAREKYSTQAILLNAVMDVAVPTLIVVIPMLIEGHIDKVSAGIAALFGLGNAAGIIRTLRAEYTITRDAVRVKRGVFARRETIVYTSTIAQLEVIRPFWGRILGYGTLNVVSTSGDHVHLHGLADPAKLRLVIETAQLAEPVAQRQSVVPIAA